MSGWKDLGMSQIEGESSLQHQHAKCLGWICYRGLQLCWVSVLLLLPPPPSSFPSLLPLFFFSCSTQQFLQAADLLISMESFRLWEELDHRESKCRPEFTPRLTHLQPNSFFSLSCIFIVLEDNQELWSCTMVVSVLLFLNMMSYQFRFFSVVQSHQSYYFEVYSPFLL